MTNLPMTRSQAFELVKKHNSNERDIIHYLESEAVMRGIAQKLNLSEEEVEYYGVLGLLHDIDWGLTKNEVATHLTKAPELLKEAGFDETFITNVISHGYGFGELPELKDLERKGNIQFALAAGETITGLVHSYALMRDNRVSDMKAKGLKKKFKDKAFAAAVDRNIILEIEKTGIELSEFFEIAIKAIAGIKEEVGLK